ncbi:hypothetical protein FRC12_016536 [Ceratobasidium sp. 428]|nr:hypothetical protein FRC12_016536 [Ceratobasidium sp. 428]
MHNPNILDIWIHELVPTNVEVGRVEVILIPNQAQTPVPLRSTQECLIYGSNLPFGLQVMNRGPYHLFVYVFYFDPNDYSVTPLYLPPSSSVAPLPYNGELTIGYGSSGAQPLAFSIDDRLSQDTGFIKVYYSTVFSEMCFIQQDGFDEQRGSRSGDGCRWSTLPFGSITYPITVLNPNSRR